MHTTTDTLVDAAVTAGHAPSIHNTQPWRWVAGNDALELYREHNWRLRVTDPDDRLTTVSCGAALHHARTALAAQGLTTEVVRLPNSFEPGHLAHLAVTGHGPTPDDAVHAVQAMQRRHTDRRPVTGPPIDDDQLSTITAAVERQGAGILVLPSDAVGELGAAIARAQQLQAARPEWQAELAYWTGGTREAGTGVPDTTIPQRPTQTAVPSRDFGHPGTLPVSADHDDTASFVILYAQRDEAVDLLRAGEALSAGWLTATQLDVSVLPFSAIVEVPTTRPVLRGLLSDRGEPCLVLRLGRAQPDDAGPQAPRRPAPQNIERR